jgi:phenylacetate-CoA ligase
MLNKIKSIYSIMPADIKRLLAVVPDEIVFGRSYRQCQPSFDKRLQKENLFSVINYAREHTVFGRENYPENFLLSEVIDVLKDLPFISSEMVKAEPEHFFSDEFDSRNSYITTTGGTGRSPTEIFLSNASYGFEWSHMLNIWSAIGYVRSRNKKITLRGKRVKGSALYEFNPIYNEFVVDTFRLSSSNIISILEDIGPVDFVHGYPSLIKEFMSYCEAADICLSLKGFMLGSEGAEVDFKKELESKFSANVASWYGQSEKVILAADVNATNEFKIYTSYGGVYIDAIDGEVGEICGTTFANKAMPLVKYRTGDYGRLIEKNDGFYLSDIRGRWGKDFIFLNKEKKIPTSSINLHSDIQREILFYQILQSHYGKLVLKILPNPSSSWREEKIKDVIAKDLSDKLTDFDVIYKIASSPDDIVRSARGKMIMLVQEL